MLNRRIEEEMKKIYGIGLCIIIGVIAKFTSQYVPLGAVAIAILIGIVVGNSIKLGETFKSGIAFSEKQLLSFAIALMGVNLNYVLLQKLGYKTVGLIIVAMSVTIITAIILGKLLKVDPKLSLLLGIGSGVCGSSAIAATEKIIDAKEEDVGLSIAIVNFLGTIGIFLLPLIGAVILKLSHVNAGILIGNTLQAVGQVTAGAFSISEETGQTATIVKMGRVLMLTPIILVLLFCFKTGNTEQGAKKGVKIKVPLFIIGFILFSFIPTFNLLPEKYIGILSTLSKYSLIVAMAGIGLKIKFASLMQSGKSALLVACLIFLVQIIFSSCLIFFCF